MIEVPPDIKRIIFDLHGVLLGRANELKERKKVVDTIKALRRRPLELVFLTNSSSLSKKNMVNLLGNIGVEIEEKEAWSAGYIMASYLNQYYKKKKVLLIGKPGFKEILSQHCEDIKFETSSDVNAVVVANIPQISDEQIEQARIAAEKGAKLLATSYDAVIPAGEETLLGPKFSVLKVEKAMSQRALIIAKPNPYAFFEVLSFLKEEAPQTLIVGDFFDIDIKWGQKIGAQTLLLCEQGEDFLVEKNGIRADYVMNSIEGLLSIIDKTNGNSNGT